MQTFFEPSFAVIPSALGPLQALMTILPHLIVVFGAVLFRLLKPTTYRLLLHYCWAHKGITLMALSPAALLFYSSFSNAKITESKGGTPWISFRGGPERTGATPGARGPFENAAQAWNYMPSGVGSVQAIDSSPTVVGNRVFFGVSLQMPASKSGSITCLDAESGGVVWQFGAEMTPPLQPVFSSPAVGGPTPSATAADAMKYLVTGEGYHVERDSRIICLDLSPTQDQSGAKPLLKWAVQTTSHVESSPCIFENKAYIGAGDDGWWCVDLETGKVLWRVEGCTHYILTEGPQADALAKLAGKTVAVSGSARRHHLDDGKESTLMFLDAAEFKEVPPGTPSASSPASSAQNKTARTVIGKVVLGDARLSPEQKGSRVKIEMEKVYADAECPPVALRIDGQPRLICGAGIDGQSVISLDAETGREIWRTPTSDPVFSAPTVVDGKVLVGLSNGTYVASAATPAGSVLALSASDGSKLWEYKTADGVLGAVAVKDNRAYACSRDGALYVLNIKDGSLIKKFETGSTMVCSPAVTEQGVYMGTNSGKVFCVKRDGMNYKYQWSKNVTPGQSLFSSPCAAGNRLYFGSATRGLFCLVEAPAAARVRKAVPWAAGGGNAEHSGIADERGLPSVMDNKADCISDAAKITTRPERGPLGACGTQLYFSGPSDQKNKSALACVTLTDRTEIWKTELPGAVQSLAADEEHVFAWTRESAGTTLHIVSSRKGSVWKSIPRESHDTPFVGIAGEQLIIKASATTLAGLKKTDGVEIWKSPIGTLVGDPALAHGLIFIATSGPKNELHGLDDSTGKTLWSVALPAQALGSPSVSGGKLFIALAGQSADEARIACRKITDGSAIWECGVDKAPATHLAVSGEHLAFTAADGTVLAVSTTKGEQTHTVLLGKGGKAPAIYQNVLLLCAENRIGAFDLTTSSWQWAYRNQKLAGRALADPILAGEAVWVSTEKQGLIAIGGKKEEKK